MQVHLNGQPVELPDGQTVGELVDARAGDRRGVAVAVDGEVLARADWDETAVPDGARVELVGAVQGG